MDYEQKYKEALGWMQSLYKGLHGVTKEDAEHYFPELKESEDEKMKKAIKHVLYENYSDAAVIEGVEIAEIVAWLEKQGEQSVEPKWCHHKVDLSCCSEEYRKAYYDGWNNCNMQHSQCRVESNYKDERIRKEIIDFLWKEKIFLQEVHSAVENNPKYRFVMDAIAWLEKCGEQTHAELGQSEVTKTSDQELEPKFKVGDWITDGYIHCKITEILDDRYIIESKYAKRSAILFEHENRYRLWTIQDAKDGDVLVNGSNIFIFHFINDTRLMGYCHVNIDEGRFYDDLSKNECFCLIDAIVTPATKEQRDILFAKMEEAGYEWDADKKELKKIENEIEIPFGAKDSELQEATYYIPEGFHAEIDDDKVVIKKDEESTAWR